MTNMGMAASQARFLGLTARKSNVEYQVQQINQQRTSLANESAGLYNQMMELSVPTPPAVSSFVSTTYVLDDTATYSNSDYEIANMQKTYEADGQYLVSLSSTFEQIKSTNETYRFKSRTPRTLNSEGNWITSVTLGKDGVSSAIQLSYVEVPKQAQVENTPTQTPEENTTPEETPEVTQTPATDETQAPEATETPETPEVTETPEVAPTPSAPLEYDKDNCIIPSAFKEGALTAVPYQIYPVEEIYAGKVSGYNESFPDNDLSKNQVYFYLDSNKKAHFLTQNDLSSLLGEEGTTTSDAYSFATTYTKNTEVVTQVKAHLEQSSNGRLSSIIIENDETYPENLKGKTYSLSAVQETDQTAYEQAMKDYEYEKALYEKSISDINSKTESIQAKDQSLELKIQQLDTEQNAIATEMESVKKVIEDNVDNTFKIFA